VFVTLNILNTPRMWLLAHQHFTEVCIGHLGFCCVIISGGSVGGLDWWCGWCRTLRTLNRSRNQHELRSCLAMTAYNDVQQIRLQRLLDYRYYSAAYDTIWYIMHLRALKSWRDGLPNLAHGTETKK